MKAFPLPSGRVAVAPSVLSADFTCLKKSLAPLRRLAGWMHFDVMDGHFVPNLSFGPGLLPAVAEASGLPVDAHLMVERPAMFIDPFAKAGASLITVHAEAEGAAACVAKIRKFGLKAGVSIKPGTPASRLAPFLGKVDLVLIMTVEPGFGGQAFMAGMLPKVSEVRGMIARRGRPVWLQVDGGISAETAVPAVAAGADSLVMGSALFRAPDPAALLRAMRRDI